MNIKLFSKKVLGLVLLIIGTSIATIAQTTIWQETFTTSANGATTGSGDPLGITQWTADGVSGVRGINVNSNRLMARRSDNGRETWQIALGSEIDISTYTNVAVSVDLSSAGPMENADYVLVEYSLDGGASWMVFSSNGYLQNNFLATTAQQTGLSGSTLSLRIIMVNSATNEYYYADNIIVTGIPLVSSTGNNYYSYQSGNWNDPATWTHDPGGTTHTATDIPHDGDNVYILNNREVFLSENVDTANLNLVIRDGGILDQATFLFTNGFNAFSGKGVHKLSTNNYPPSIINDFVTSNGGTTEYNAPLTVTTQTTYNNLRINTSTGAVTQLTNFNLNGNLHVKQGTFQVNDATSQRLSLTVMGDVTVDNGAVFTVGSGRTTTTTDPNYISGGVAPFIDYYDKQSHRIVIEGNFTNNGTATFTDLTYPVYNALPVTGIATVYFMGATNNTLTCNGITNFYNLVVDKGIDKTYSLTINSIQYNYFKLFGANTAPGDGGGANPNIRKALWVRTGSLELDGLVVIPSLSEGSMGGNPNSDFHIPANGAFVVKGPEVVVLTTADDYTEINAAYGLTGGSNAMYGISTHGNYQAFSIYGKFQVDEGYVSTRESGGFITRSIASGDFIVNGGTVDAKQFRSEVSGSGLASYIQTGGDVIFRGRHYRNPPTANTVNSLINATLNTGSKTGGISGTKASLNIDNAANVFNMTGGNIYILDVCGGNGYAIDIFSEDKNINVTGGTIEIAPQIGATAFQIRSKAPFGNLVINKQPASTSQVILNAEATKNVDGHLMVINNVEMNSGEFNANNYNFSVGGDFLIENGATYTSGSNKTILNGAGNQILTVNTPITQPFNKFELDKPANSKLTISGSQSTISVKDSLIILNAELDDGGKTILFTTSGTSTTSVLYNSGKHTGTGKIELADSDPQIITGDGTGIFQNLELNNIAGTTAPISLATDITIEGALTFSQNKLFNIGTYKLKFGVDATVVNAGALRFIQTSGNTGDGGVKKQYSLGSPSFTFPIGTASTNHANAEYTPATLAFGTMPTTFGSITVVPVGYEHPNTTSKGRSLTYFWKVKSENFTLGSATVNHSYMYSQNDVVTGGDITEDGYVAATYQSSTYSWTKETSADVNESTNTIGGGGTAFSALNYIDGEFTCGDDDATDPFGTPTIYYSRQSGAWNNVNTWSLTGHNTNNPPSSVPGITDVVIIGGNDSIFLGTNATTANTDVQSCATLKIEAGSALDIGYNPGCNFVTVIHHENGNGNFRLTCDRGPLSGTTVRTFQFPIGDFSDFNQNLGTTELYTTNPVSGTTFYLPNGVTSYGNLIISPLGGSNIIFPNHDLLLYGNLITRGQNADSWFCPSWNSNYPGGITRVAKTITINGNMIIEGGALVWYGNGSITQDIVVYGDVYVAPNSAIDVWSGATSQSMKIGGSLVNNTVGTNAGGISTTRRCDFTGLPITFFGANTAKVTNTVNNPLTIFETVTVDKGSSRNDSLIIDIGGTLNTPTNGWLTLLNGTLKYARNSNLNITTTNSFTIPSTAELYIDSPSRTVYLSNANRNDNDIYLNGKLTLINGNIQIGSNSNNNQDIEYSGDGYSEIEIFNGNLTVNGQIRRNPSTTSGVLKYGQSGGTLTVNGQATLTSNAKLEILNSGSEFNMSAGTINIIRGGGGATYGDLYLRPDSYNVTGGEIVFSPGTAGNQNYILDATCPLWNLTINGNGGSNAYVKLLVSPLELSGDLTLVTTTSTLDANSSFDIPVTISGNFDNSGIYKHQKNLTIFNGGVQAILGTSAIEFYDLEVTPVTSLSLNKDAAVLNDLNLASGTLLCGNYYVNSSGNIANNATYTDNNTGIVLNGTKLQYLSGTGTWGQLELDNFYGARLENSITLQKDFLLTKGIMDISRYMLTLGVNCDIVGSNFGENKMITSDGVYSDVGVRKFYDIYSGASIVDSIPIGTQGLYTPVAFTYTDNTNVGYIRFNNINSAHPGAIDPGNVLDYFWEIESSGMAGVNGSLVFHYYDEDVQVTGANAEADYIAAGLLLPGTTWSKASAGATTDNVDETKNSITFNFTGASTLSGEFTAGMDAALPDNVPEFTSINNGDWSDPANWQQTGGDPFTLTGAPNGFIIIVDSDDEVTLDANYALAYRTEIKGRLKVVEPFYGHNLGTVSGSGTMYLESGTFPAGKYSSFLDCSNNSTIEYGGTGSYTIDAYLYSSVPKLHLTGTGTRVMPNNDITVCSQFLMDGPTVDNSVHNRSLTIQGTMERYNTTNYISGTGSNATVKFQGASAQTIGGVFGDFSGVNSFNNLEIENAGGLTINPNGQIEVVGDLLLTDGVITTTITNTLTITNTNENCVFPVGGKATSYVDGPLTKLMNQGDGFDFPVGKGTEPGNKIKLTAVRTGTDYWTVEYFTPNATASNRIMPLTYVNNDDYWAVSSTPGNMAKIGLDWEPSSDLTPLMTENGLSDMRVARYETSSSSWGELSSQPSGNNSNGTVTTTSRITLPSGGTSNFTIGCINIVKPRAQLNPSGAVCGTSGIPVTFTYSSPIPLNYTIDYTIDGVSQAQVLITPSDLPYTLPTPTPGVYQLSLYTYNSGAGNGVVDPTPVEAFAIPTVAVAGADQSLCGVSTATLAGNSPSIGTGQWSVISGTGGTVVTPTVPTSDFNGANGNSYILRWTITNGGCTSTDDVSISFPLLPVTPLAFTQGPNNVCAGQQDAIYTVPNDATVTYSWAYSGTGETIIGTGNSVEVDFDLSATSGTLSVNSTNGCGTSTDRTINITINPKPTITVTDAAIQVCQEGTSTTLPYSSTTGSPTNYSLDFASPAEGQGFADLIDGALPVSPILVTVPNTAPLATYNASLTVSNSSTGCYSDDYAITLTVMPLPAPTVSGPDTTCNGTTLEYTTELGMSNYSWTVDPTYGTILSGANTNKITVDWFNYTALGSTTKISISYEDGGCPPKYEGTIDVMVFKIPETGPVNHIDNAHDY